MSRRPTVPFREVVGDLRTGDLVFGRGRMWSSRVIEAITRGTWSHVSMVILPKDLDPGSDDDRPLLWESTSIAGRDVGSGREKTGAMLVLLEERCASYFERGTYRLMGTRRLHGARTDAFLAGLRGFVGDQARVREADYPAEYAILRDFLRHRLLRTVEQGTFFCSELVASTYAAAGVVHSVPHPQSYSPRDFSEAGYLPLMGDYWLGDERWIAEA